jgi:hypothetical protein
MAAEKLIPLSTPAAQAIRDQQQHLRERWPAALPPQLFPAPPEGRRPISYAALRQRLADWEHAIGLHDEAGLGPAPDRVTAVRNATVAAVESTATCDTMCRSGREQIRNGFPARTVRYRPAHT